MAVHRLARCASKPTEIHWEACVRMLGYIKRVQPLRPRLRYRQRREGDPEVPELVCYCDASYATALDGRSVTGWVFFLAGAAISSHTGLQRINALSATEAEFIAISDACKHGGCLIQLLGEMGMDVRPFRFYEDNEGAMKLTKEYVFFKRSKHILNRYYHVRRLVADGWVDLHHVGTSEQVADVLTKALKPTNQFEYLTSKLLWFDSTVAIAGGILVGVNDLLSRFSG